MLLVYIYKNDMLTILTKIYFICDSHTTEVISKISHLIFTDTSHLIF